MSVDLASKMLVIDAPQIMAIPVEDCLEVLTAIPEDLPGVQIDRSAANIEHLGYQPDFRLRSSVVALIKLAAAALPDGYRLLVKEAYRPLDIQERYFAEHLAEIGRTYPHRNGDWHRSEAAKYVAPPEAATHITGGAFDVTLLGADNRELDMGTEYDAVPRDCSNRCFSNAADISPPAKSNRSILFAALRSAGLVNYPFEWWHWSYGDRYWAYVLDEPAALYGPAAA